MAIDFNKKVDECIQALADDNINYGADQLYELAVLFAKAGQQQKSFEDLRGYIIQAAEEKTDKHFIREKLKIAERELHERRNRAEKTKKIITNNITTH